MEIGAPDPYSDYGIKPNLNRAHRTPEYNVVIHTNSQGFRCSPAHEEYSFDADPNRCRVMLLGPSFAFAWGVNYEDSFAARLAEDLTKSKFANGKRIEIVNRGVPGIAPVRNLNWFKHVGVKYQPDLLIQFAYASMIPTKPFEVKTENGEVVQQRSLIANAWEMSKRSAIIYYSWLVSTRIQSQKNSGGIEGLGRDLKIMANFDPAAPDTAEAIQFYDDLKKTADASGSPLVVMYFPPSYGVHPQDIVRWKHQGVNEGDSQKQIAFDRAFIAYLESRGIHCLDLSQPLIDAAPKQRLHYWLDVHWTPAGNALVAQAMADYLKANENWALGSKAAPTLR
jgi:hypothetical protein